MIEPEPAEPEGATDGTSPAPAPAEPKPSSPAPAEPKAFSAPTRPWLRRAALVVIAALALYLRSPQAAGVFAHGRVFILGDDSYFHMRRVLAAVRNYPWVPVFDAWSNHPEGALIDWPIGFDLVLASLCKVAELLGGDRYALEAVAVLFNPALGVLVTLFVYAVARRVTSELGALLAAVLAAVLPVLAGYSNLGRVDHHAAEPLLILVPLHLFLAALDAPSRSRRLSAWAGVALALAIAIWPGSIAVGATAFTALVTLVVFDGTTSPRAERLSAMGTTAFGAAAPTGVAVALIHPWALRGDFSYYAPSWLQPFCFAVAWATSAVLAAGVRREVGRLARVGLAVAPPIAALALGAALVPPLRTTVLVAIGYVGRGEAQISQVTESMPLFANGPLDATQHYTVLLLAVPVFAVAAIARARAEAEPMRTKQGLAWLHLVPTALLAASQIRLGSMFAPLFCILCGHGLSIGHDWLRQRLSRRGPAVAAAIAAAAVAVLPVLPQYRRHDGNGAPELVRTFDALMWLAHEARRPGDAEELASRPAFAVMARWQWGHYLTYLGKQANVSNPLGQTPANLRGVRESVRFFLATDPGEAAARLERLESRYVLTTPFFDDLPGMVRHTSSRLEDFTQVTSEGWLAPSPRFYETMGARLTYFDGRAARVAGVIHPPLRRFRLVFEGGGPFEDAGGQFAYAKLFELVRGARIEGRATPGAHVLLRSTLVTNAQRRITYRDETDADEEGRFGFVAPYATGPNGATAAEPYEVLERVDGAQGREGAPPPPFRVIATVAVPEVAIEQGSAIEATPPRETAMPAENAPPRENAAPAENAPPRESAPPR